MGQCNIKNINIHLEHGNILWLECNEDTGQDYNLSDLWPQNLGVTFFCQR